MKTVLLTRILYYVIPTSNICVSILSTNRDTGKTALKAKHCYLQIKASPILQSSAHVIFRRSIAGITPGPRFCLSPRFHYEYSMVVKGVQDSCWAKAPCYCFTWLYSLFWKGGYFFMLGWPPTRGGSLVGFGGILGHLPLLWKMSIPLLSHSE